MVTKWSNLETCLQIFVPQSELMLLEVPRFEPQTFGSVGGHATNSAMPPPQHSLYSLFWGTYQVNLSQLQMVIAGYIYNYEHVITQRLVSAVEHLIRA
jgi:hypothetical protein